MSETTKTTKKSKNDVLYILRAFLPKKGKVKYYQKRALELSKIVNKNPPWSWRYVQSVDHGTVEPSRKFIKAMQLLENPRERKPRTRVQETIIAMSQMARQGLRLWKLKRRMNGK